MAGQKLVQLGKAERPAVSPVWTVLADKFFAFGALAIFFGVGWFGVHAWLMLTLQLPMTAKYGYMRTWHVLFQIYLFWGVFILGYLLQAAPRFLGTDVQTHRAALLAIPSLAAGVALLMSGCKLGNLFLAAPFAAALCFAVFLLVKSRPKQAGKFGAYILLSLISFTAAPFVDIHSAGGAAVFYWAAVASVLIGVGQLFLAGFARGQRLESDSSILCLHALVLMLLLWAHVRGAAWAWHAAGGAALAEIALYSYLVRLDRAARAVFSEPASCAFVCGLFWGAAGAFLLARDGLAKADLAFHIWATGWSATVIIAVSAQVMTTIAGRFFVTPRGMIWLLLCWQIVPFGRGFGYSLPFSFSMVVGTAAAIVTLVWGYAIVEGSVRNTFRLMRGLSQQ